MARLGEPLGTVWAVSHSDGRAFGSTPIAPARGIEAVIVNGELVCAEGDGRLAGAGSFAGLAPK